MTSSNKGSWLLVLAVLLVPILPWVVVGPWLEPWAAGVVSGGGVAGVSRGWLAVLGVGLLAADSFLPVPSTLVMSGLGLALGLVLGGAAAALGAFLSGTVAYWVCRRWGAGLARRLAGAEGLARVETMMGRHGPLLIAATRSVPVVQEATACLAGAARMPVKLYFSALALGCLPTGFAYAAIGASALQNRTLAVVLSLAVPLVTWPCVHLALRRGRVEAVR